jgi:phosphodiesterase/alkaline phosphatase D-like protein
MEPASSLLVPAIDHDDRDACSRIQVLASVVQIAASRVTSSGATVGGSVNPVGRAATYQFDYGTSTSYGSSVPSPAGSAGSGTSAVTESASLTGLRPGTTYHYRIEATNATGTTDGPDRTVTTPPLPHACQALPATVGSRAMLDVLHDNRVL